MVKFFIFVKVLFFVTHTGIILDITISCIMKCVKCQKCSHQWRGLVEEGEEFSPVSHISLVWQETVIVLVQIKHVTKTCDWCIPFATLTSVVYVLWIKRLLARWRWDFLNIQTSNCSWNYNFCYYICFISCYNRYVVLQLLQSYQGSCNSFSEYSQKSWSNQICVILKCHFHNAIMIRYLL